MLEIIALIFLAKEIGKLALSKGLPPGRWKFYLVLAWIAGEIIGGVIGILIFGDNNLISAALVAIGGAISGYVILKAHLSKRPDFIEGDIDNIGKEQS